MVTLITATCDQPDGFALCERWMQEQTVPLASMQWIVVDDGEKSVRPTCGQTYVRRVRPPMASGSYSICSNLLAAARLVRGDRVLVIEHDDYYAPNHVEKMLAALDECDIAGDDHQRYYHVGMRRWKQYQNRGAALCQTGFRRELLPTFVKVATECRKADVYGVDAALWKRCMGDRALPSPICTRGYRLKHTHTVVGIKGLPGRKGLGVGHQVDRVERRWAADPRLDKLVEWAGLAAAKAYKGFAW